MKICVIIDNWFPLVGGGPVHVWETVKILASKYNYQIDIFTRKLIIDGKKYCDHETYLDNKINIYRIGPCTNFFNIFGRFFWNLFVLIKLIEKSYKNKYLFYHAHAYLGIIPAKIISLIFHKPLIYTIHGIASDSWIEMQRGWLGCINIKIEKYLLTKIKCNQIITVSHDYLLLQNVNKNISVIPNGVDLDRFDQIKERKSNKFTIIFVGRLTKQKGLIYLIKAINILKNKFDFQVNIIGNGSEKENIQQQINEYNLINIIHLKGKIIGDELISEYKKANLFVLPSIYEGQPLTILEAWAAKLPVIATDVGDNNKFIINDINGYLIPTKNVNILADKIIKIFNNQNLQMGLNGYNLVKNKYLWEKTTYQINNIYKKILDEK